MTGEEWCRSLAIKEWEEAEKKKLPVEMPNLRVVIDRLAYYEMLHYVDRSKFEVSGMGTVTMKDGLIYVHRLFLPPQENRYTMTDITADDMGKMEYEVHRDQLPGRLRCWWHSHVDFNTFWSGTDEATILEKGAGGWCLAIVVNKKREIRVALYFKDLNLFIDEIPIEIDSGIPAELIAKWSANYDAKVKNVPYDNTYFEQGEWEGWSRYPAKSDAEKHLPVSLIDRRAGGTPMHTVPLTQKELKQFRKAAKRARRNKRIFEKKGILSGERASVPAFGPDPAPGTRSAS
jgi:hypothetical protein